MINILSKSILFQGVSKKHIEDFLKDTKALIKSFKQGQMIFSADESPSHLYILLEGSISINKTSYSGHSILLANISKPGEIFGEVYAFLDNHNYSFYTVATSPITKVLFIPKSFFSKKHNSQIYSNLLKIFAEKAFFLTEKVKILSAGSLRKKIIMMILSELKIDKINSDSGSYSFNMSRENTAQYLGVARPSLSREIASMTDEGLIKSKGNKVLIPSISHLESILNE